jgi:hypothetical protein
MKRVLAGVAVLAVVGLSACGGGGKPKDTRPAEEIARELVTATKANAGAEQKLTQGLALQGKMLRPQFATMSEENFQKLMSYQAEGLRAELPKLDDGTAKIYTAHFTAAELAELLAFYNSPTGQKFLAESSSMTAENQKVMEAWGQQAGVEAFTKAQERARAEGILTGGPAAGTPVAPAPATPAAAPITPTAPAKPH